MHLECASQIWTPISQQRARHVRLETWQLDLRIALITEQRMQGKLTMMRQRLALEMTHGGGCGQQHCMARLDAQLDVLREHEGARGEGVRADGAEQDARHLHTEAHASTPHTFYRCSIRRTLSICATLSIYSFKRIVSPSDHLRVHHAAACRQVVRRAARRRRHNQPVTLIEIDENSIQFDLKPDFCTPTLVWS